MRIRKYLINLFSDYRGLVIAGTAVPASFVYRSIENFYKRMFRTWGNPGAGHDRAVEAV